MELESPRSEAPLQALLAQARRLSLLRSRWRDVAGGPASAALASQVASSGARDDDGAGGGTGARHTALGMDIVRCAVRCASLACVLRSAAGGGQRRGTELMSGKRRGRRGAVPLYVAVAEVDTCAAVASAYAAVCHGHAAGAHGDAFRDQRARSDEGGADTSMLRHALRWATQGLSALAAVEASDPGRGGTCMAMAMGDGETAPLSLLRRAFAASSCRHGCVSPQALQEAVTAAVATVRQESGVGKAKATARMGRHGHAPYDARLALAWRDALGKGRYVALHSPDMTEMARSAAAPQQTPQPPQTQRTALPCSCWSDHHDVRLGDSQQPPLKSGTAHVLHAVRAQSVGPAIIPSWPHVVHTLRCQGSFAVLHTAMLHHVSIEALAAASRVFQAVDHAGGSQASASTHADCAPHAHHVGFALRAALAQACRRDTELASCLHGSALLSELVGAPGHSDSTTTTSASLGHRDVENLVSFEEFDVENLVSFEEFCELVLCHAFTWEQRLCLARGRLLRLVGECQLHLGRTAAASHALDSALQSHRAAGDWSLSHPCSCSLMLSLAALARAQVCELRRRTELAIHRQVEAFLASPQGQKAIAAAESANAGTWQRVQEGEKFGPSSAPHATRSSTQPHSRHGGGATSPAPTRHLSTTSSGACVWHAHASPAAHHSSTSSTSAAHDRVFLVQRPCERPAQLPLKETWMPPPLARERVAAQYAAKLRRRAMRKTVGSSRSSRGRSSKQNEWRRAEQMWLDCVLHVCRQAFGDRHAATMRARDMIELRLRSADDSESLPACQ